MSKKQDCTDILGLIVFIIFWSLMIFIASFSFVYGNPSRIIFGSDTFGNVCGRDNSKLNDLSFSGLDLTTKKYLFFMDVNNVHQSLRVCIEKCPDRELSSLQQLQTFSNQTGSMLCRYDIPLQNYTTANTFHNYSFKYASYKSNGPCPLLPVPESTSVLYRCLPLRQSSNSSIIYNLYAYLNSLDQFKKILNDVYLSWKEILGMCVLSSLLVFCLISLLRCFTFLAVYAIFLSAGVSSIVAPCLFLWCFISTKILLDNTPISKRLEEDVKNEQACLSYFIISTIIMIILLSVLFTIWKKIKFVIQLFIEVNKCFHSVPSLFFLPFLSFAVFVIFFIFWIFIVFCMATSDFAESKPANYTFTNMNVIEYVKHSWVHEMWWYHIIGLIITSEFIVSCQKMVVAGTICHWYFERDDNNLYSPILKSSRDMTKYHLGSVITGSIGIFIFKIPHLLMKITNNRLYINKPSVVRPNANKPSVISPNRNKSSVVSYCCLQSCKCYLWCFEKFHCMNHNSYTYIVMNGSSFFTGGKQAFNIIARNAQEIAGPNSTGDLVIFLGKCSITGITTSITVLILQISQYHFYAVPVFVITIFAFFLSYCFLSLYEMIIDTMFLCLCEDKKEDPLRSSSLSLKSLSLLKLIEDYWCSKKLPTSETSTDV